MGEVTRTANVVAISKKTQAIGELLRLARAGKLLGFAYASVIVDPDGDFASGTNAILDENPQVAKMLGEAALRLVERANPDLEVTIAPKKRSIIING